MKAIRNTQRTKANIVIAKLHEQWQKKYEQAHELWNIDASQKNDQIKELETQLNYFDGATNLAYIVIFLRNSGERLRAIWLAKNTLNIEIKEAAEWVDSVRLINEPTRDLLPETPPRNMKPSKTASHWPPTVTERMKSTKENNASK